LLLFGTIAGLCFAGAALMTGITRFYAYATAMVLIIAVGIWLNFNPPLYILTTGLVIEVVGIYLMVRFLRRYPIPAEGGAHE
jgi:hypothetical protein